MNIGPSSVLPEALDRDQEIRQYDSDLAADSTGTARWVRRG
jgi:hypothetical protein